MTRPHVIIRVLGAPATKGNARAFVNKATGRAVLSSFGSGPREKKLRSWDHAVREAARIAVGRRDAPMFVDKQLEAIAYFYLARPANHFGKGKNAGKLLPSAPPRPRKAPDVDKLARSTFDALHGIVFEDDARIVRLVVEKRWAMPGQEGAEICVSEYVAGEQLVLEAA